MLIVVFFGADFTVFGLERITLSCIGTNGKATTSTFFGTDFTDYTVFFHSPLDLDDARELFGIVTFLDIYGKVLIGGNQGVRLCLLSLLGLRMTDFSFFLARISLFFWHGFHGLHGFFKIRGSGFAYCGY